VATDSPVLALDHISKRFGRVVALRDVSLRIDPGTVHALLGENGAGKTTLMHVAFGMTQADAGDITVEGRAVSIRSPADAIALGLGMVHQHFSLVPAMTVAENLALGGHGRLQREEMTERVHEIANATGFALDPQAPVGSLTIGAQQRVEIAKALACHARVLILDEPTAVLAPAEVDDLLRWIRRFADAGNAVVLITHKLHEALAIADRVTVLRQGRVVREGDASHASVQELTDAMIGTQPEPSSLHARPSHVAAARKIDPTPVLAARAVTVRDERGARRLRDASVIVHRGEILGVAGVEGAGQRELLRALAGRVAVESGTVEGPAQVGFVPEDRHHDAVLLDRPLTDSVALSGAGWRRGRMPWRALRARTQSLMQEFDVRAPSPGVSVRSLSGGNQQKLVLGREMELDLTSTPECGGPPAALVVENPTRGLDVRATADIHARLRAARDQGMAIVLYSSDLDEVLALASRMVVLHDGEVHEVPLSRDAIGRAMLGA
jgi:ABC-type uncharacterized transport system ATPase subunit